MEISHDTHRQVFVKQTFCLAAFSVDQVAYSKMKSSYVNIFSGIVSLWVYI